jgi:glycerol-3-phosphate O-acyltransferase
MNSYHEEVANVSNGVRAFFEKTFTTIDCNGPKLDPSSLEGKPLMLVCTHRSHVDYFLIGYLFHLLGFKNLRFAAGDNLTKLPWIGRRFTSFGAFTVERDVGFDRNYVKNLCFRVVSMIEQGDTVIVFPEGGRSYSGAMLEIRTGILGASVISQAKDTSRDVAYIPIAVSYESPPDVPWFAMQLKGKLWRKRSNPFWKRLLGNLYYFGADFCAFVPFLLANRFKKKYGIIHVDYSDPVTIPSIIDVTADKVENARDDFSAQRVSMQKLSEVVYQQLFKLYRILPMHVIAYSLENYGSQTVLECADRFPGIIAKLKTSGRNVKELEKNIPEENTRIGIKQLQKIKAITFQNDTCSIKNSSLISYFAATIGS